MQFRSTCIVGVETILNLKSDGKIGQRPNVDKKKCELVKKCKKTRTNILSTPSF